MVTRSQTEQVLPFISTIHQLSFKRRLTFNSLGSWEEGLELGIYVCVDLVVSGDQGLMSEDRMDYRCVFD